jgi:C1A family cysteine protease
MANTRVLDLGWREDSPTTHVKQAYRSKLEINYPLAHKAHFNDRRKLDGLSLDEWQVYEPDKNFHACAASAVASAIWACADRNGVGQFQPSVRFIYYIGRYLQNRETINEGVSIYSCLRACHAMGFCDEDAWKTLGKDVNEQPTLEAYNAAKQNGITTFEYCYREPDVDFAAAPETAPDAPAQRNLDVLKAELIGGSPVIFGMLVDQAYLNGTTTRGVVQPPQRDRVVDRHCTLLVGYEDDASGNGDGYFIVRDSLGRARGENGYVKLAYAYLADTSLTNDFWVVRSLGRDAGEGSPATVADDSLSGKRLQYINDAGKFRVAVMNAYRGYKAAQAKQSQALAGAASPPIVDQISRSTGSKQVSDSGAGGSLPPTASPGSAT